MEGLMRRARDFGGTSGAEGFWPGDWIIVECVEAGLEAPRQTIKAASLLNTEIKKRIRKRENPYSLNTGVIRYSREYRRENARRMGALRIRPNACFSRPELSPMVHDRKSGRIRGTP
ncbi:hypothetical protein [Caballeronia sp. DA-9]|uniref:hypothetical protein n=1 Tax=Caballeronia sp. DA-9 TaxID=3436237 RepID=UPI003F680333